MATEGRPIVWIGSSRGDLKGLPKEIRQTVGIALRAAQLGEKHASAKPLKGFGGAGVLEIIEDYDGDTYRAVYTVKFTEAVYVLHCFQKKSKSGIATAKQDLNLIKQRLKIAEAEHKKWQKEKKQKR